MNNLYIVAAITLLFAVAIVPIVISAVLREKKADSESSAVLYNDFESQIAFEEIVPVSETLTASSKPVALKNKALVKPKNYAKPLKKSDSSKPVTVYEKPVAAKPKKIINVPYINQNALYPTGCESVSAVMALKHAGYSISVKTFIDNYLDRAIAPYIGTDGKYYGYDPREYFLGNPYSTAGWGCKAPVIERALNRIINSNKHTVKNITGTSLSALKKYLDEDIPVIIWATQGMTAARTSKTWKVIGTERTYTWTSPNHCLLLVGYDNTGYYFNDPLTHKNCRYEASVVQNRYNTMGRQAIVIMPKAPVQESSESTVSEEIDEESNIEQTEDTPVENDSGLPPSDGDESTVDEDESEED